MIQPHAFSELSSLWGAHRRSRLNSAGDFIEACDWSAGSSRSNLKLMEMLEGSQDSTPFCSHQRSSGQRIVEEILKQNSVNLWFLMVVLDVLLGSVGHWSEICVCFEGFWETIKHWKKNQKIENFRFMSFLKKIIGDGGDGGGGGSFHQSFQKLWWRIQFILLLLTDAFVSVVLRIRNQHQPARNQAEGRSQSKQFFTFKRES